MKVIWTEGAADDLAEIVAHIKKDSPDAAVRVAKRIFDKAMSLGSMGRGVRRASDGAWEIFVPPWPYVIIYEVMDGAISIEGVRHTSRDLRQ